MGVKARRQKPALFAVLVLCAIRFAADVTRGAGSPWRRFWSITAIPGSAGTNDRAALFPFLLRGEVQSHVPKRTLALLIEGDLLGPTSFEPLFDAVRTRGRIVDARIYASQARVHSWSAKLKEYGIKPVVVPQGGTNDPKLMAMAADAEEICLRPCGDRTSGIVIASGSFRFATVLRSVRAWGLQAFAAIADSGHNTRLSHPLLEEASGNRVVSYAVQIRATAKRVTLNLTDPIDGIDIGEGPQRDPLPLEEVEQLESVLRRHGYTCEPRSLLLSACAKFFHVNQLGILTVWPLRETLLDAHNAMALQGPKNWRRNPGELILVEPFSRGSRNAAGSTGFNQFVRGGGPFILKAETRLVDTMLRRLAYTEHQASAQCIEVFWSRNRKRLLKHGFTIDDALSTQKQKLDDIFRSEGIRQRWKVAARPVGDKSCV